MRNPRTTAVVFFTCLLFLLPCRHAAAAEAGASASASATTGGRISGVLFFDLALGLMIPLADDDYDDVVDLSFKLAFLRGGFLFRIGPVYLGPELAVDFTPGNVDEDFEEDLDLFRMRIQGGARLVFPIPRFKILRLVGRFDIGLDVAWGHSDLLDDDDSSTGLAVEFAFGFEFLVHKMVAVGFSMGLPISSHAEEIFGRDYTSLDLDFMAHVAIYPFEIK